MKIIKPFLIFAVIVVIGVGIGWLASRRANFAPPAPVTDTPPAGPDTAAKPSPLGMTIQSQNTNEVANPDAMTDTEETTPDDMIGELLGADMEVTNIVTEMVALYPKLTDAGKLEAVEHLTNLVPDEDYTPLANILTNETVLASVASHLLTDLIDRPNEVKMPLMLAVARNPNHPGAKEARENLELIVDPEEDPGEDWDKWQKAIDEWVKENPE